VSIGSENVDTDLEGDAGDGRDHPDSSESVWVDVVGQDDAIRQLEAASKAPVHAYLLLGPPGAGKRALARGFAARLLAMPSQDARLVDSDDGDRRSEIERSVRLALREQHPDLRIVAPEGLTFRRADAENLVHHATRAPIEAARKVVLALGCEAMEDEAAGFLLKAIEEPSASTVFVLLATEVEPELATIASRCVIIEVRPLATDVIAERLVIEGVQPDTAESCALAAGGDLDRARTLATDDRLSSRHRAWRDAPTRLDGTGHAAATVVAELSIMVEDALAPLRQRQAQESAVLSEEIEQYGLRGGAARREMESRHKREVRRFRTAELRFGLATLAGAYRDAVAMAARPGPLVEALTRIDEAAVNLARYPNEALLLQALVARLPPLEEPR
jgi:DNA polymerase-3 subunit delta'